MREFYGKVKVKARKPKYEIPNYFVRQMSYVDSPAFTGHSSGGQPENPYSYEVLGSTVRLFKAPYSFENSTITIL